jgi:hypothetical protein
MKPMLHGTIFFFDFKIIWGLRLILVNAFYF